MQQPKPGRPRKARAAQPPEHVLKAPTENAPSSARHDPGSCASWLRRTHRRDSICVDFDDIASGICAAREAFDASRASRNDRVRRRPGLDDVPLFELLIEERVQRIRATTRWVDLTHEASFGA